MSEKIKYKNLHIDVKEFLKLEIKNLKTVDDIFTFQKFRFMRQNLDQNIFNQVMNFKMTLQLLINLYHNYDFFKGYGVKYITIDMKILNNFYYHDKDSKVWRCCGRPEIIDIEEALSNYLGCFEQVAEEFVFKICTYCDNVIEFGKNKCDICDTYVNDMFLDESKRRSKNMGKSKVKEKEDPEKTTKIISYGHKDISNKVEDPEDISKMKNHDKGPEKWKCGTCGFLSDYGFINCKICGNMFEDGKWSCKQCTCENSIKCDKCVVCETVNENIKVKKEVEKKIKDKNYEDVTGRAEDLQKESEDVMIGKDEWKCSKCGLLQSFEFINCDACRGSRAENGLWRCEQCTLVNKCKNIKCEACDYKCVHMDAVFADNCTVNEKNDWKCPYIQCRSWNPKEYLHCKDCHLWRYNPCGRGQELRILCHGNEECIWICEKCCRHHKISETFCSNCGDSRFEERFCMDCRIWNDGQTLYCNICHRKLC